MAEEGGGSSRSKGTVKWFNGWKGFGFITPDEEEHSEDLFVHQTSIKFDGFRTLYDGQRVEFDVEIGDDGRTRATNVVVLRSSGNRGGRYGGGGRGGNSVECYNCGRFGHLARDCYHRGGGGPVGDGGGGGRRGRGGNRGRVLFDGGNGGGGYGRGRGGGRRGGFYGGGGGRGGGRGECYNCGEEGHFARDCPKAQN